MGEEVVEGVVLNIEMVNDEKENAIRDREREEGVEEEMGKEQQPIRTHLNRIDSLDKEANRVSGMPTTSKVITNSVALSSNLLPRCYFFILLI